MHLQFLLLTCAALTSRVPVFEERIDNIVGIAYAMDMLEYVEEVEKLKEITVKEIAHMPTYFVPGKLSRMILITKMSIDKSKGRYRTLQVFEYCPFSASI
jgi:CBS domain containing-hemolysin-like protein